MTVPLKKELYKEFSDAVQHTEKVVAEEGFSILMTKSIDEILKKKLGLHAYPRYSIILACIPTVARMALDISKDIGTLFPCSFAVYEDQNRVFVSHLSIMKTSVDIGLASQDQMAQVIQITSERIQSVWKRL